MKTKGNNLKLLDNQLNTDFLRVQIYNFPETVNFLTKKNIFDFKHPG